MNAARDRRALIIPALNEAGSIAEVLAHIPPGLFTQIIVVDNGSRDQTAALAREAGAQVIEEPRRGYGQACLTGLAQVRPGTSAVAFIDADLSDDPADLERLVAFFDQGAYGLVIGSRVLGTPEPGSLTPLQRFGNALATRLIRWIWGVSFTDLGPLRVLSADALRRLGLGDRDFGWNVEMQAKAARLGLKVGEVGVSYRRRRAGESKISGTLGGSIQAGLKILLTIYRCWRQPLPVDSLLR
ncbi:MAG TPA: glycosyltransferase family 2 protein [Terriglobia bacterium]|nr:glycosyltransferase family 2 protein [Terriglobia bacterium]